MISRHMPLLMIKAHQHSSMLCTYACPYAVRPQDSDSVMWMEFCNVSLSYNRLRKPDRHRSKSIQALINHGHFIVFQLPFHSA